jgi:Tol biopolymer transport system component
LDGSEMQPLLEDGSNAVLSPDGTRMVYSNAEGGLFIYTLATGVSEPVVGAGPNPGVVRPFWSPDGRQLAFTGTPNSTPPDLYLSNLDGKPAKLVDNGEPIKLIQGWLPDGRILYVTMDENGSVLKDYNPQTGETSSLFNVPQLTTVVAVSKDGKRLALNWLEESGKQMVYVFTLDGSQRKPLLEVNSEGYIRSMLWTPDGSHLILDLSWAIPEEPYTKALVQVDTCQVIPITNLEGSVLDWMP